MQLSARSWGPLVAFSLALALAGCGTSFGGAEEWGGYTEAEAKRVMSDPNFREQIIQNAPADPRANPYEPLVPTKEQVEAADLRKVTVDGQEAWEYKNAEAGFCLYLWHDPEFDNFATQVGPCSAD